MDHGAVAAPADAALEKIRIPYIRRARLGVDGRHEHLFVIDIGLKGVFVERSEPLAVGAPVEISFALPGNEREVSARCRVAWWHGPGATVSRPLPAGLGLEFVSIEGDGFERIRRHVLEYLGRSPRHRRFNRRPEESRENGT